VVSRICLFLGKSVPELIGSDAVLDTLDPQAFTDEKFGIETIADIIAELKKPGRDPRQKFEVIQFNEGIHRPSDLQIGMELRGVVTNVTDFGAFVDIGVHQDGLVHLSEIGHTYIKHPSDALSVGQAVNVKVLAIDHEAKRIGLSIKATLPAPAGQGPAQRQERPRAARMRAENFRPENQRSPKPPAKKTEAAPQPKRQERKEPPPERKAKPKKEKVAPLPSDQPPASSASLEDLMAKFNRGLR
jgi:uncharacterized protein